MKAILMSIKPQYVARILNKEKTIEVRKKFPKDYVGWVYIYCTKGKPNLWLPYEYDCFELDEASQPYLSDEPMLDVDTKMNGKVVARFNATAEEITPRFTKNHKGVWYITENKNFEELCIESCLCSYQLNDYLQCKKGTAIHITKLEIFDKPKELSEFWNNGKKVKGHNGTYQYSKLTRAPQSFMFIEV